MVAGVTNFGNSVHSTRYRFSISGKVQNDRALERSLSEKRSKPSANGDRLYGYVKRNREYLSRSPTISIATMSIAPNIDTAQKSPQDNPGGFRAIKLGTVSHRTLHHHRPLHRRTLDLWTLHRPACTRLFVARQFLLQGTRDRSQVGSRHLCQYR